MSFNHILHYETGELKTEMNLVDGKPDGECKNYWKNGNPQYTSTYVDGVLHGDVTKYDEDGQQASVNTYEHGVETHCDGVPVFVPPEEEG